MSFSLVIGLGISFAIFAFIAWAHVYSTFFYGNDDVIEAIKKNIERDALQISEDELYSNKLDEYLEEKIARHQNINDNFSREIKRQQKEKEEKVMTDGYYREQVRRHEQRMIAALGGDSVHEHKPDDKSKWQGCTEFTPLVGFPDSVGKSTVGIGESGEEMRVAKQLGVEIPSEFNAIVRPLLHSAQLGKYPANNWLKKDGMGCDHRAMYASIFRHVSDANSGVKEDRDTKLDPRLHAAVRLMMDFVRDQKGLNDE